MVTKGFNLFFQEDEEDCLDDPIILLDSEDHTVFSGTENDLRNITIEDPGYVVNISVEDYELRLQKSLLKELKNPKESSRYANNNGYLLRKCRTCSIKVVDCHKFPWYYRNKFGSTNKIQYPNIEHNVVEIEDKDEEKATIIDLTENEHVACNNRNDIKIQEEYTNNIEKVKANRNEFKSVDYAVDGTVINQTYERLSKPVLNIRNESHTIIPRSEADQATDLIISTYTRLTDKAIQKIKNNIESWENNYTISKNLGKSLLLGSKSFTKTSDNLLTGTKNVQKVANVSTNNINNYYKNVHHKQKKNKKSDKSKNVYISEQISKTKIKIKRSSLKSKDVISKNNYKEKEDKECNLNATHREQCDSLKNIEKKHNTTNEKQQNNCENKQERIQHNSYSYVSLLSPVLTKITTETKKRTSWPNRNIGPDRINRCSKQVFSANRIIPHFHDNAFLNHPDISSKNKSNTKNPKRSKETVHNYETKKNKNTVNSTEALNIRPMTQMPNKSTHQRMYDYCIANNNATINNNEPGKKSYNTNMDISNISAIHSVNSSQVTYKLPVNNGILLKTATHASADVVQGNVNNIYLMNQSKNNAAQLEEERLRYLLPSNLPNSHTQNIFSYSGSNLNNESYIQNTF